jgi:hypothetical protein
MLRTARSLEGSRFGLRRLSVRISIGTPAILTEVLHGFFSPYRQTPELYLDQVRIASFPILFDSSVVILKTLYRVDVDSVVK